MPELKFKPSVYISCRTIDPDEEHSEDEGLCIHNFSTIKEMPDCWIVMCEELQKIISKNIIVGPSK